MGAIKDPERRKLTKKEQKPKTAREASIYLRKAVWHPFYTHESVEYMPVKSARARKGKPRINYCHADLQNSNFEAGNF